MDRRTFVLLSGAASGGLLGTRRWPRMAARLTPPPAGQLRFTLDGRQRWTLSYYGEGAPVPLVSDAELGVHIGAGVVTLAALEAVAVAQRTAPEGRAVVVSGTTNGIAVEVAFTSGEAAPAPAASITVTLSPDRVQGVVRGIRYCAAAEREILPGDGPLLALINGYHSWNENQVVRLPADDTELTSHALLGLTRAGRGLGLAFDPGEPGEAAVHLTRGALEARSDWLPARPLRPDGDAATLRIAFDPAGDGLSALAALFAPTPADYGRFTAAPAGWCSWHGFRDRVTERDVIANLEFCAAHFDPRFLRTIQIDDGYQKAVGDWDTNEKFPSGHRWLTDQIHARGFQAGLWIAPFTVSERSGIPTAHPQWLLTKNEIAMVRRDTAGWGGNVYGLDGAHPEVQAWLRALTRRIVRDWGYDYLMIDFLLHATAGDAHFGGATHAEAYRAGLTAMRDGLGTEAFLLGCGAPLQHAVGAVNGMRIGADVAASWSGIQGPARAAALRRFYHRATWYNDPDGLVVRPPLTPAEARVWASIVALSGGMTLFSDDLPKLPADRVPLLQRTIPVAPVTGRAADVGVPPAEVAPAIVLGENEAIRIPGPWKFRTGDEPAYASQDYDEEAWETLPVPAIWERAGHPSYDGYAWYRTRFLLPSISPERWAGLPGGPTVHLELGRLDDVDGTFVNGVKVGQRGEFPPNYRGERQAFRRYPVPWETLNWGGENVLAIRVYDGGDDGGFWSVRRDRPPAQWVVEGVPGWWTVALVNWEDEPRDVVVPLASLGITGAGFRAYDVWADAPLPDVQGSVGARLEPHSALVVALRAIAARPVVIGTTRHVVQGAVDLAQETWEAATRTLRGKSVNLDGRAYAVTIAVPPGMRPGACKAEPPCVVNTLRSGHAVMTWGEGTRGRDVEWELSFLTRKG